MICRSLFWALLVYVSLDVSASELPGAFMFDADSSVDSVETARARLTRAALLALPRPDFVAELRYDYDPASSRRPGREVIRGDRFVVNCLPRAICSPPQPSEDPH